MGRPRLYATAAERQAAHRKREKEAKEAAASVAAVTEPTGPRLPTLAEIARVTHPAPPIRTELQEEEEWKGHLAHLRRMVKGRPELLALVDVAEYHGVRAWRRALREAAKKASQKPP